ncbi:metallophosphoesterase family protein [Nitrospira sp. M1]
MTTVGVISDTHGLIRPEALAGLEGSELILHAGDIGSAAVLERLQDIAPVYAVRGNNDRDVWSRDIPLTQRVEVGSHAFYVLHEIEQLNFDPSAVGVSVIISGHSHKPLAEKRTGVLYLNPGSAGPRRFRLPVTVARLYVKKESLDYEIVELSV